MPLFENKCVDCGAMTEQIVPRYTETTPFCKKCGGLTEREISAPAFHDWNQTMGSTIHRPWVTNNIRADGKPLEITSHAQLREECKKAGVVHVPDKQNRIG